MRDDTQDKNYNLLQLLKLTSPGTPLREALEMILQANTGGLIVVGDTEKVIDAIDGGFKVNCYLTPPALAELAKMDGAIILSRDIKKILYANTQLVPDYLIPTNERGTRHRAAERMAKQTGALVIAISQSRGIVSLYQGEIKYVLKTTSELVSKATQALQTLERYRLVFNEILDELGILEFQDEVKLFNVINVIQKGEMLKRIKGEIERYIVELGREGRLIEMQLKETVGNILNEYREIIRDYTRRDWRRVVEELEKVSMEQLLEPTNIMCIMGFGEGAENLDISVSPRGYRVLYKIPRLSSTVIENVVKALGDLPNIMNTSTIELTEINEVGEKRASSIKQELERLKNKTLLKKY
ncbi:DNA integrity scanning diadenylate cyclase DisA [Candidatus Aerophobetes bacterium]|nr:DNA integrity scanning diadenylate cyclase DisA [Candidatus Aerophobetes bacterium]